MNLGTQNTKLSERKVACIQDVSKTLFLMGSPEITHFSIDEDIEKFPTPFHDCSPIDSPIHHCITVDLKVTGRAVFCLGQGGWYRLATSGAEGCFAVQWRWLSRICEHSPVVWPTSLVFPSLLPPMLNFTSLPNLQE